MYPVDSGKDGLEASSPDVRGFKERRMPMESLDGEDTTAAFVDGHDPNW